MNEPGNQSREKHSWITVRNETDTRLVVPGTGESVLVFSPFERRRLRDDVCTSFRHGLERLEELRCVSVRPDEPSASGSSSSG